jgi:hypothetical protein
MDPRDLLQRLLDAEGLTANGLAAKTGGKTKQPQIHRFLNGTAREPKRSTWEPVAKYFRIPVDSFFDPSAAQRAWDERHPPIGGDTPHSAGTHPRGPSAQLLSQLDAILLPPTLEWETAMSGAIPSEFILAMPDDALAPQTERGTRLLFVSGQTPPRFGVGVLVRDTAGNLHVRRYVQATIGGWRADARNTAYQSFAATECTIVAWVQGRFDGTV